MTALVGHSWIEIAFSCAVLLFGLALVAIEAFLAYKENFQNPPPSS